MKKSIIACTIMCLAVASLFAATVVQPKTVKYEIEGKSSAAIYMTEIYTAEYWAEIYLTYEEDNGTYDEAEAEKIIYEFISKYKVDHKFSTVEIEDLKAASTGDKKTTMLKRLIFRQVRK